MYCSNCGTEIQSQVKFCPNCGHKNESSDNNQYPSNKNEILIHSVPVFISVAHLLATIPLAIFFSLWNGIFFGGLLLSIFKEQVTSIFPGSSLPIVLGFATFIVVAILAYVFQERTYSNTEYFVYPDRIEYTEGFLGSEKKTILLKNAVGCNLVRGIIQKQFGLGSIRIDMPGFMTSVNSRGRSGFCLADLDNPEEVYEILNNLIKQNAK